MNQNIICEEWINQGVNKNKKPLFSGVYICRCFPILAGWK